jgi:hypothetical protein
MPNKTRPTSITLSISDGDIADIEALRAHVPLASQHAVLRAAARLGLSVLDAEPERLAWLLSNVGVRIGGTAK